MDTKLMALIDPILKQGNNPVRTHYAGCHRFHVECLAAEVERIVNRYRG